MRKLYFLAVISIAIASFSCNKRNEDYSNMGPEVVREWTVNLRSGNVVPGLQGRQDEGLLLMQVRSNNSIVYQYNVTRLAASDMIMGGGIYAGDPVSNGPLLIDFDARQSSVNATGVLSNLRQSLIDSLMNDNVDLYVLLRSVEHPDGALRVQLNKEILFAADIPLSGAEEVPPVNTTATGLSSLRLVEGGILYSKLSVMNVEPTDALTVAHIHRGNVGQNGPVFIPLVTNPADFGVTKTIQVSDTEIIVVVNEPTYVNVHSVNNPAGKIRGQIR